MAITYLNIPLNMGAIEEFEIHPVKETQEGTEKIYEILDWEDQEQASFYSVYGILKAREDAIQTKDVIADCTDYDMAYTLKLDLSSILERIKS